MKKRFVKLQKLFKNGTLHGKHIEADRDSDAIIAQVLGWSDLTCDLDREWVCDIPVKEYECLGRCVVPKFTTSGDGLKLLNHLKTKKIFKEDDRIEITYHDSVYNGVLIISHTVMKKGVLPPSERYIEYAPTLPLLFCKLFIDVMVTK